MYSPKLTTILIISFVVVLVGCSQGNPVNPTATIPVSTLTLTPIPKTPTPTPPPAAAFVNGEVIPLDEFQASLKQLIDSEAQTGTTTPEDTRKQRVIDDLINQTLLAQAASQNGFAEDKAALSSQIEKLAADMGGSAVLDEWIKKNGYTNDSFRSALRRSTAAAWQRNKIIVTVPLNADQVHARQILVLDETTANKYYGQLQSGADFATLAFNVDPLTGGDLGWFPQGFLTQKDVEAAAFSLQPGQYSQVIKTTFGYQIIQVIARDPNHPLSSDALKIRQQQALVDWINQTRSHSKIELHLP